MNDVYPIPASRPAPEDVVQVLMTEKMARHFERECLGYHTVGHTYLAGPVLLSEDDSPTYIIGVDGRHATKVDAKELERMHAEEDARDTRERMENAYRFYND
jgi:hypothetical protein